MDKIKSIGVTDLAKILIGDEPCLYKFWSKLHYEEKKEEVSTKLTEWKIRHTALMRKVINSLDTGKIESEQWIDFLFEGHKVLGRFDITQSNKNELIIYECKSGEQRERDILQLWLYMYLVSKIKKYSNKNIIGVLVYENNRIEVSFESIPSDIHLKIKEVILELMSEEEPKRISCSYCKWCKTDCPYNENDRLLD